MKMKNILKAIRYIVIASWIIIVSQATVLAETHGSTATPSGLGAGRIISSFILLLLLLLTPLVKKNGNAVPATKQ
jgi:hypothetical protein